MRDATPYTLLVGNSDGIGLAVTRLLLERGESCVGVSRSPSPLGDAHAGYIHHVVDVADEAYPILLQRLVGERPPARLLWCVGIGELLTLADDDWASRDAAVFEVNLMAAMRTLEVVAPAMLAAGGGHILGLSSQADAAPNPRAPSYNASKAGLSTYLEGLALALRPRGVFVTNVRFGFVDTKMAKSNVRPFMLTPEAAARLLLRCLERRPMRYTRPRRMAWLLRVIDLATRVRVWWG